MKTERNYQYKGNLLSLKLQSPRDEFFKKSSPLPLRICFRADLYPREYFPDLTTSASLAEIDSADLAALDFFVGAMAVIVSVVRVFAQSEKLPNVQYQRSRFELRDMIT